MIRKKKLSWVLASAVAATLVSVAAAQNRINADGRLTERNNRIGSGGSNEAAGSIYNPQGSQIITTPQGVYGNQLITGNVTGGRAFQGTVNYTNPTAFRGTTAGELSDNFIRNSSGAPIGGVYQNNAQRVQAFYGPSQAAPPPPGYRIENPSIGVTSSTISPMTRQAGDMRMGAVTLTPSTLLPTPGQLLMPGPVDPTSRANTFISASPLYGVKQLKPGQNAADQNLLDNSMGLESGRLNGVRMDPALLQKMRDELRDSSQDNRLNSTPLDGQGNEPAGGLRSQGSSPLSSGFETPRNGPLSSSGALDSGAFASDRPLGGTGLSTGASLQSKRLTAPRIQSTQYAELETRLQQNRLVRETNETMQRNNQQLAAKRAAEKEGVADATNPAARRAGAGARADRPGSMVLQNALPTLPDAPKPTLENNPPVAPLPGGNLSQVPKPEITAPDIAPAPLNRPAPLKITSLADGVQAKALGDMLREAETQVKGGKYASALEQYDMAEQVAPNNPLILMGRANVELARTYYTRAEMSLRQAFTQDQALLMAQFDLRALLGEERLETIVRDLQQIANREQKESIHVFLLAYIAYNTNNERRAAAYLDLAEKRSGNRDQLYSLIRKHWALPADSTAEDLNK